MKLILYYPTNSKANNATQEQGFIDYLSQKFL